MLIKKHKSHLKNLLRNPHIPRAGRDLIPINTMIQLKKNI